MKMTFEQWKNEVNKNISAICGMVSDDLPDCCYLDWYQDGVKPASAAKRAIKNSEE
jgi:hypothetical protein